MTQDVDAVVGGLVEVVRHLLGDEAADELIGVFQSSPLDVLASPATFQARIEDILGQGARSLHETPENWGRLLAAVTVLKGLGEKARQVSASDDRLSTPTGLAFHGFLSETKAALGDSVFWQAIARVTAPKLADVLHPAMATLANSSAGVSYEQAARGAADALRCTAEGSYKEMLLVAVELTYQVRGVTKNVKTELGALMAQCRDLWTPHGGPVAVLDDRIRIVRNSESHRHTLVDVRAMEITFTNRPPNKPPEVLGPLDRRAFHDLIHDFFGTWLTMYQSFLALDAPPMSPLQPLR